MTASGLGGWEVRAAQERDLAGVLALWRSAGNVPTPTDDERSLRALLAFDPQAIIVAELRGGVVGSVIVGWDGWRGTFYRLAVRPQERRHGLATELVREGERRLLGRGAVRLNAIVVADEREAIRFWEAVGYGAHPEQLRFVCEPADRP